MAAAAAAAAAAAFDGCRLNRNGSNAQLFVFEVGSRIWQSDAKSHRILILLLLPTCARAACKAVAWLSLAPG